MTSGGKRERDAAGVMLRAGRTQIRLNQDDWKKGPTARRESVVPSISTPPGNVDEIANPGQERLGITPQVGPSRHRVDEPRVRGQRSERLPADDFFGSVGIKREDMRRTIVGAQVSMDGVMQAPVCTDEDLDEGIQVRRLGCALFDQEFGEGIDRLSEEILFPARPDLRDFRGVLAVLRRKGCLRRHRETSRKIKKYAVSCSGEVDTSVSIPCRRP